MSLLLRLLLLMDLLGPKGLEPPLPTTQPSPEVREKKITLSGSTIGAGSGVTLSISGFSSPTGVAVSTSSMRRMQHNTFAESLEWAVSDSQAVVKARFESETPDHEVTFSVLETIKGTPKAGQTITVPALLPTSAISQELLLFLQDNKNPASGPHPFRMRSSDDRSLNGLTLDGETEVVLMDYRKITRGQEILEQAKRAAAYPSAVPARKLDLRSYGTPTGRFANMLLVVPVDSRLDKLAQEWASQKDFDLRLVGLHAIRPFKSQKNIEIVMPLLQDTRSRTPSNMGKWQMAYYEVRSAAIDVLQSWDVRLPELSYSGPVLQYRQLSVSMMQIIIIGAIITGWCLMFYLLARWGRSRGMDLGFWRLNFTAISFVLAALAGWTWIRSHHFIDELMFPLGQSQHQIASYNGGIQYVVVREWTMPSITVSGHFDKELVEDQWAIDRMNRTSTNGSLEFIVTHGLVVGPARVVHPFTLFRMPYWILVLPLSLVLVMSVFRISRLIVRLRRGLCRRCGYDLRESQGGLCPECGTRNKSGRSQSIPLNELLEHQKAGSGV